MRFFGVIACVIGLALTGYSAIVYKAPQIEADLQARAEQRLAAAISEPVDIVVDGRFVILRGAVSDDREKGKLLELAGEVWGGLGPVDELERLTIMAPYRFEASKDETGGAIIQGFAPNEALREQLKADARAIFGDDAELRIELATGVPEGDWRGIAGLGMDALATLDQGKLLIADTDLSLVGDIASAADMEAIDIFAGAAPEGFTWQNDLSLLEPSLEPGETAELAKPAAPFSLTVLKTADGDLSLNGFAPDDETRQAMIDRAKDVALEKPVVADIQIAAGMPDANWPDLVFESIDALAGVESGAYHVVGNEVSFSGDAIKQAAGHGTNGLAGDPDDQTSRAAELESAAAAAASTLLQPPAISPYVMTVYKNNDGGIGVEGALPDAAVRDELLAALKQDFAVTDIEADIDFADGVPGKNWPGFVVERAAALKAVKSGSLSFKDYESHLIGVVDAPEDIAIVRTRLAAIDRAMTIELNPIDPRPVAALELVVSPDKGVTLWGNLPQDLTEEEAVLALGLGDYEGGLSEDGRGDADNWRKNLTAIGSYLPQFDHVGVTLGNDQSRIEGKVHAKRNVDRVREKLKEIFDGDQEAAIDISVTELTYADGAQRKNPLTGKEEVYDRGHWLSIVAFSPGLDECRKQTSQILASHKITFLRGETLLDARGQKVIDELAAVAIKCLDGNRLRLGIGGHTDSRGAADMNQTLSQARADIVMQSLIERGVDGASLIATGYGAANPISDNETEKGRAQNRRITFEWNESGTEG